MKAYAHREKERKFEAPINFGLDGWVRRRRSKCFDLDLEEHCHHHQSDYKLQ